MSCMFVFDSPSALWEILKYHVRHGLFDVHVLLSKVLYAIIAPEEMNEHSSHSIIY